MTLMQKMFGFSGRMRRRDYWLISIGMGVVVFILSLIAVGVLGAESSGLLAVQLVLAIPQLWISLALMIKRTHDRDKPALWVLFYIFVPVIGWVWSLIELGFLDGTQGPNRFGPSPKGIGPAQPVAEVFS